MGAAISDPIISGGSASEAAQISRARIVVLIFSAACILLALWLWLGATPLPVAFAAALAAPVIAVALIVTSHGRMKWFDKTHAHLSLFAAVFPPVALVFAIRDFVHILNADTLFVGAGLIAVGVSGIVVRRTWPVGDWRSPFAICVLTAVMSYALLAAADAALDPSPARPYAVVVTNKYVTHGKGGPFYNFSLGPWSDQSGLNIEVPSGRYYSAAIGGFVCIFDHSGALGARWVYMDNCPAGMAPPPASSPQIG